MAAVPFQVKDRVHQVLQGHGAGNGAFLGDVADEKGGDPGEFGLLHQAKGGLPHLVQGTGGCGDGGGVHGLDRVQGQEGRLDLFHHLEDVFQAGFRGHQQLGRLESQAVGPKFELDLGFFPGNVEADQPPPAEPVQDLEDEGGLADARVAAHQDHGALHHGASQGAVEFADAGDPAHLRGGFKMQQGLGLAASGGQLADARGHRGHHLFGHGTPGAALRAAPQPFGRLVAAALADEDGFSGSGHLSLSSLDDCH